MKFVIIDLEEIKYSCGCCDEKFLLLLESDVEVVDPLQAAAMLLGSGDTIASDNVRRLIGKALDEALDALSKKG